MQPFSVTVHGMYAPVRFQGVRPIFGDKMRSRKETLSPPKIASDPSGVNGNHFLSIGRIQNRPFKLLLIDSSKFSRFLPSSSKTSTIAPTKTRAKITPKTAKSLKTPENPHSNVVLAGFVADE